MLIEREGRSQNNVTVAIGYSRAATNRAELVLIITSLTGRLPYKYKVTKISGLNSVGVATHENECLSHGTCSKK